MRSLSMIVSRQESDAKFTQSRANLAFIPRWNPSELAPRIDNKAVKIHASLKDRHGFQDRLSSSSVFL